MQRMLADLERQIPSSICLCSGLDAGHADRPEIHQVRGPARAGRQAVEHDAADGQALHNLSEQAFLAQLSPVVATHKPALPCGLADTSSASPTGSGWHGPCWHQDSLCGHTSSWRRRVTRLSATTAMRLKRISLLA